MVALGAILSQQKREQPSCLSTYLRVKVEACDTSKWVPHGIDTQKQVSNVKGII